MANLIFKSKQLRSSEYELVKIIDEKNERWLDAGLNARERMFEAIRGFVDIDGGSWPKDAVQQLVEQGRHAASINVAKQKLETLHGSIASEKYDFSFMPVNDQVNTLTNEIKHLYYDDKDNFNYVQSESETLLSGLLHAGTAEIDIDYRIRRTGGIVFRHVNDGLVLKDPDWKTVNNSDWREAIKHGWLTPQQIIDKYETDDPDIHKQAMLDKLGGILYEDTDDVEETKDTPKNIGSRYLVIEYRWLEKFKTTRLYICRPGKVIPLPLNIKEEEVKEAIDYYGINPEDIHEYPYEDDILYFASCCPQLSRYSTLSKGKHRVQCGGIGFFRFAAMRKFGIEKGIWEYIQDIQRMLNYRHSKIDDVIASAAAGLTLVDQTRLPDGKNSIREIEQKKTRPDAVIGVNGNPEGIAALFPVQQVPEHLFREVNNLIDLFDRVSPVTPALEGSASKDESGILFEMRHAVTKLGTYRLLQNWQQHLMDRAKAWYNLAPMVYKGLYRKVKRVDTTGYVEFNAVDYRDTGRVVINSLSDLPEARVVVSLSSFSPTEQMSKRMQLMDMQKVFSANPQEFLPEIRFVNHELVKTLQMDPEEKAYLDMLFGIQKGIDMVEQFAKLENLKASIANSKFATAQSIAMLQQVEGQIAQISGTAPAPQMPESVSEESPIQPSNAPQVQNIIPQGDMSLRDQVRMEQ